MSARDAAQTLALVSLAKGALEALAATADDVSLELRLTEFGPVAAFIPGMDEVEIAQEVAGLVNATWPELAPPEGAAS